MTLEEISNPRSRRAECALEDPTPESILHRQPLRVFQLCSLELTLEGLLHEHKECLGYMYGNIIQALLLLNKRVMRIWWAELNILGMTVKGPELPYVLCFALYKKILSDSWKVSQPYQQDCCLQTFPTRSYGLDFLDIMSMIILFCLLANKCLYA